MEKKVHFICVEKIDWSYILWKKSKEFSFQTVFTKTLACTSKFIPIYVPKVILTTIWKSIAFRNVP